MDAVLMFLIHGGAELAQGLQVEVNRTAADCAAAEGRDERLTQTVHQRAREQNRNAGGAGQRIHVGHVGQLYMAGVDGHDALLAVHVHIHAVQSQQIGDHMHIANLRHILQHRLARRQQCGDHGLAHEVLCATHLDRAIQRLTALDMQHVIRILSHATLLYTSNSKNAIVQFAITHVLTP